MTNHTTASLTSPNDTNTEELELLPDAPDHNPTFNGEGFSESSSDSNAQTTPSKIYLKDYTPPVFIVGDIKLDIKLYDEYASVDSTLSMKRQQAGDLTLLGRDLTLKSIIMNGQVLSETDYILDAEHLVITNAPDEVLLEIKVTHEPQKNTALEGLYQAGEGSNTMFVTQCEPEGFRKITYFPDRPDVLTTYTTRVEADKRYPTLLANGNLLEEGEVADDTSRHYAIWHDPTKKPSYLFACVIADLDVLTDHYVTSEGREVLLEIYAKSHDIEKCHVAMQALKDAMKWDEDNYGRAYDLDRYMVVAVSQFNMGAMENKGLNIFNTVCVLSTPETTTDTRSFNVKAVVAHEYFHNWTGNRITCRDWFQLCLKEGFTVYRDQSFSADQSSPAVQRIDDVALLRAHQFAEDAGPLAHPPRPSSFVEINNFYTTTVYEKGAEIVRMLANLLGKDGFRAGTDEYFNRYDGLAVTVEDFIDALSVGAGVNNEVNPAVIQQFMDWYTQPATPMVQGHHYVDAKTGNLVVHLSQSIRHVAGFDAPKALPIPVNVAIFARQTGEILHETTLLLTDWSKDFVIDGVTDDDKVASDNDIVVSVLRGFSAPVQLNYSQDSDDLAFLLKHETDGVNQWQTAQTLVNQVLLQDRSPSTYLDALKPAFLQTCHQDKMLAARLLDVPAERELAVGIVNNYEPEDVKQKVDVLKLKIADILQDTLPDLYASLPIQTYADTTQARGERALRNVVLDLALTAKVDGAEQWANDQYTNATCMTERMGALNAMVRHGHPNKQQTLADFYERFVDDPLVIDLWFGVQASDDHASVSDIRTLLSHADFDWHTPNRVRAVVSNFASQPTKLWTDEGLNFYTEVVGKLDGINPVLASRLLQALSRWYTLAQPMRDVAQARLSELKSRVGSKNVLESLESLLGAG